MLSLIISILISLFFSSYEYKPLTPFGNTTFDLYFEKEYYSDISIFKKPETIKIILGILTGNHFQYNYYSKCVLFRFIRFFKSNQKNRIL